jgi:hypothetical protein
MTDAHYHKLQLIILCDGHSGAISVMQEMHKRYSRKDPAAYYRFISSLKTNKIYGSALYALWKETCQEDNNLLLTYSI